MQTHHVAQFLHEERVVGQLETLGAMRLQTKELDSNKSKYTTVYDELNLIKIKFS